ncbi:hypothetical protein FQA39_LY16132 [Lamprigera yunnana]|nr:hypothetical protein FQA39_LY16132 [Lamprigera yunnana]
MAVDESMYTRGRSGEGLIFSDLIDMLEETNDIPESIAIWPPEEPPDADTDKDSDLLDEEILGNIDHLRARILRFCCAQTAQMVNDESITFVFTDYLCVLNVLTVLNARVATYACLK